MHIAEYYTCSALAYMWCKLHWTSDKVSETPNLLASLVTVLLQIRCYRDILAVCVDQGNGVGSINELHI